MEIFHPTSLIDWLADTSDFLARHEAEHGLMLGVARAMREPPPDAYFACIRDDDVVFAAAMRLDWRLILSREARRGALALVAKDADSPLLKTVLGPSESVERFTTASTRPWRDVMSQGIYECRVVTPPPRMVGKRRLAAAEDRDLLVAWLRSFVAEALHEQLDDVAAGARVDEHIAERHFHVLDVDGTIVSLAAAVAPTVHGIRVNHVYTPPEYRGRGYASTLVASLTQALLDSGHRFTFLHTDLANPTSNRIYMRIGYRQVATFRMAQL